MKTAGRLSLVLLPVVLLGLPAGCATLPKVSEVIRNAPDNADSLQIASARGFLSPEQSKTLLDRLKQSVDPTDLLERHAAVIETVTSNPLVKGNRVTLLIDGPATYAAMFEAVRSARDHVHLETYVMEDDATGRKFADLLLQKRSEGVQVDLVYDAVGSFHTPASFFQRLRDGGIRVVEFNPINPLKAHRRWGLTHRDHRKVLVVDGRVAITGGVNISEVYREGSSGGGSSGGAAIAWRDTDVRIEGPAVAELQKLFLHTWRRQKGPSLSGETPYPDVKESGNDLVQVIGSTPGQMNRRTFIMYASAIVFASNSIHLTNSYFIPDRQTLHALTDAAKRGVDVKIIVPKKTDIPTSMYAGRYYYADLLKAGVKLYQLRDSVLHAKTGVIDGVWSTVGSTNMDFWSFLNNDEVNAVILSRTFAIEMEAMFARDLAQSDPIRLEEWEKRPLYPRFREWLSHLLMRWL